MLLNSYYSPVQFDAYVLHIILFINFSPTVVGNKIYSSISLTWCARCFYRSLSHHGDRQWCYLSRTHGYSVGIAHHLKKMCYCSVGNKNCKALFLVTIDVSGKRREVQTASWHSAVSTSRLLFEKSTVAKNNTSGRFSYLTRTYDDLRETDNM